MKIYPEKLEDIKGFSLYIIRITLIIIAISPSFTYIFLYYPELLKTISIEKIWALILGLTCITSTFIFLLTKPITLRFLLKKNNNKKIKNITKVYFEVRFKLTCLIQGILTIGIILNYFFCNKNETVYNHLKEISNVGWIIAIYILWAFIEFLILADKYEKEEMNNDTQS